MAHLSNPVTLDALILPLRLLPRISALTPSTANRDAIKTLIEVDSWFNHSNNANRGGGTNPNHGRSPNFSLFLFDRETVLQHLQAFSQMKLVDSNFKSCPTEEEWMKAEKVAEFLNRHFISLSGRRFPLQSAPQNTALCMIMKLLSAVFSALIALNPFAAQSSSEEKKGSVSFVKKLSAADYDAFVQNDMALVEFFAPWCGHCKKLAPEYEKAAETLEKKNIFLGSVDCTEQKEVCAKYKIQGYPTMKIFRQGNDFEYQGPRDADGIIRHMTKQSEPAVRELDAKKLDEFIKSDEVVFVANFPPESSEAKAFASVANKYRNDFSFGKVNFPPLAVYKKFDEGYVAFSPPEGKYDEESMAEFVRGESIRLVDEIGPENYAKYMESGKPLAYLFYGSEEQKKSMADAYEAAIKPYKGKIHAVFIDADKFGQHADVLNLEKKWPGFVIHDMTKEHKFPFSGKQLDADTMKEFVRSFSEGKLKPSFKSEPIPEKQEGSVKMVVHDNFNDVVLDDKKDVLVEVYAPWCGACKNLAPTYEKLAEKYAKHSDKVVIAKFDGVANDLPETVEFKLQHFPTLLLFKAQKGKRGNSKASMVEYTGGPSLNTLIDFISKEGTNKVAVEKESEAEVKKEEEPAEKAEL